MRLVMVAHAFPRWSGDVAGSFLGRLAETFVARGHTVAVVAPSDQGRGRRLELFGAEVLQVRYAAPDREDLAYFGDMGAKARTPSGALAFVRLIRALRNGANEEAKRIGAGAVHAFWWIPGGAAVLPNRLPVVVSLMGTDVALMRPIASRVWARRVLRRAARVTALSTFLAEETRRILRLPSLAIERVPVPVDTARFDRQGTGGGGVVYLGRLSKQKRVDLLINAVADTRLDQPVRIIGDGPARAELESLARARGLSNVQFLGVLPDEEVPLIVGSADVAAFPSEREGLGLAAAEALMLGTPVVATTDGGGVLDLVREGEGACIVPPTAAAIGSALQRCLADPGMRTAAGRAGERIRKELSPDAIAARFEQLYGEIA